MSIASLLKTGFPHLVLTAISLAGLHWGGPNVIAAAADGHDRAIVGYLPEYRIEQVTAEQLQPLTDVIAFSAEVGPNGRLNLDRLSSAFWKKVGALQVGGSQRWLLTVGGWERSQGFAHAAESPASRKHLIADMLQCCQERSLAGIDLDWEHPHGPVETERYAALIEETHAAFAPRGLLLTAATAGWQRLPERAWQSLDRIHLMAYDNEGVHATYESALVDTGRLLGQGAKAGSICLGIPCYGRGVTDRARVFSYAEIVSNDHPPDGVDLVNGVSFNSLDTVARKALFAKDAGLAGVMFWELTQDSSGELSLMRRAAKVLQRSP